MKGGGSGAGFRFPLTLCLLLLICLMMILPFRLLANASGDDLALSVKSGSRLSTVMKPGGGGGGRGGGGGGFGGGGRGGGRFGGGDGRGGKGRGGVHGHRSGATMEVGNPITGQLAALVFMFLAFALLGYY